MDFYSWIKTTKTEEGRTPVVSEDMSFTVLLYLESSWALVSYSSNENFVESIKVSRVLDSLLRSGMDYPPALAISMKRLRDRKIERCIEQPAIRLELEQEICEEIRKACRSQRSSAYCFVEAKVGDSLEFRKGEFYWLVARTREKVWWIDRDLELGLSNRTYFELSAIDFESLREVDRLEEI